MTILLFVTRILTKGILDLPCLKPGGGGGVLPYMGYIGMCRCEGYGFQAVYSSTGYINQSFGSRIGYYFSRN